MRGHFLIQRGFDNRLGELFEQPIQASQIQALRLGLTHQLHRSIHLGTAL
jgi:hypothetical protein